MSRIIFILNNVADTRSHKRIQEFMTHGYEVKVYGCQRIGVPPTGKCPYDINVFAVFGQSNYARRLRTLLGVVRKVLKETRPDDIYYCFGMDNAMAVYLQSRRRMIYEEADLQPTYIKAKPVAWLLERMDKRIIRRSLLTVLTSDGYLDYHFGGRCPENCAVICNKLNPSVLKLPVEKKREADIRHLRFGFVGGIRSISVFSFARTIGKHFPQHEVHFHGYVNKKEKALYDTLKQYPNIFFHGAFTSPDDLPRIYSGLDMVYATYDITCENVRYAEPNKLYEAIYFETPILVSSETFLADKVKQLGIGYDLNVMDENEVCRFVNDLTAESIAEKASHAAAIDKAYAINENSAFFNRLHALLKP